jgi:two-component system, sporulation sensor kinase E
MRHSSVPQKGFVDSHMAPLFTLNDFQIESYQDGVVVIDFHLQVLAANRMIAELVPGCWHGECPIALHEVFPDISEEYGWVKNMVHERTYYRNHVLTFLRDGKMRTLLADSYPIQDADGHPAGMCLFLKDIGNIVSLEHQVQYSEKLATVGKIAAGVAHEIRNPLTSIKGFLQIMRNSLTENGLDREHSFTDVMLSEIERLDALVGELLLLSKPRQLQRESIELEDVVLAMEPLIASECLMNNIELDVSLQEAPPVYADRELLKQVILNLVKNAIEAMAETGHGKLSITSDYLAPEKMILLAVKDTGPGIPPYMMDRIFDAFFTTKETGTGLGLPICQRLIADVGGQIKVKSKGYGTTFTICLPVRDVR